MKINFVPKTSGGGECAEYLTKEDKNTPIEQTPTTESTFDFLKRHMTPLGEGYQVQGRLDEIQKCTDERITELSWIQCYLKPDVPSTRAKVVFSDIAAARELYNLMRNTKMVALRNWLD